MVRRPVAVIVAPGGMPAALAVKAATLPIVFGTGGDPERTGLVAREFNDARTQQLTGFDLPDGFGLPGSR
jgi:hypothetical protein